MSDPATTNIWHSCSPGMGEWCRTSVVSLDSWRHAICGAELDVAQLSEKPPGGSLLAAQGGDRAYSTGKVGGDISLLGPLSEATVTLGIGLSCPSQSLQWLREVVSGSTYVWMPGEVYDAVYRPGSTFFAVSLTLDRLEEMAADLELVLDAKQLGETRISARLLNPRSLDLLRRSYERLHAGGQDQGLAPEYIGDLALDILIEHFARRPHFHHGASDKASFARIIDRARSYIMEHLDAPISIAELAIASFTSRRTLYRAFEELLGETPQCYVRNLRLNRIRRDLSSPSCNAGTTVTEIATRWGVNEFGRLAGDYRKLFGELPSDTLKKSGTSRIAVPEISTDNYN